VACTQGSLPKVSLDNGTHFIGGTRNMITGAGGANKTIAYTLFQPNATGAGATATTTAFGSGTSAFTVGIATTLGARTVMIFGAIPPAQDVQTGDYTDSVIATVEF
jgi:spore coat protein U-like protein